MKITKLQVLGNSWIITIIEIWAKENELVYQGTGQQVICVAVEFLSQVIFIFLLFLGKVMYTNKVDTKEK